MKLSEKALALIKDQRIRLKLAIAMNCTDQTIIRNIKENHKNLTMAVALQVIREETGLTDVEILEEETEPQRA